MKLVYLNYLSILMQQIEDRFHILAQKWLKIQYFTGPYFTLDYCRETTSPERLSWCIVG